MMFLQRVEQPYVDEKSVHDVVSYIFRDTGNGCAYAGGFGIPDIGCAEAAFNFVRAGYGEPAGRRLKHIIISPDPKDLFTGPELMELANAVCAYYMMTYQTVYSVHTDVKHRHVHIVVNTVSYTDGRKLHEGKKDLMDFERYCRSCYESIVRKYAYINDELRRIR